MVSVRTIRISEAVWTAIAERGKFGETEDDVLRRVFDLPPDDSHPAKPATGRPGRGGRRHATKRISARVMDERLSIEIEGSDSKEWKLPSDKSDKPAIKRARDEAHAYARARGATQGQIDAITKAMNDGGYYSRMRGAREPLDTGD